MATEKHVVSELIDALGPLARARAMMGEYVLYWRDKVVGGLYDGRLLVKDVPALRERYPDSLVEEPYPGAKDMLRVPIPTDQSASDALTEAFEAAWPALPMPKKRR